MTANDLPRLRLYFHTDGTGPYHFDRSLTDETQPHLLRLSTLAVVENIDMAAVERTVVKLVAPRKEWTIDFDWLKQRKLALDDLYDRGQELDNVVASFIATIKDAGFSSGMRHPWARSEICCYGGAWHKLTFLRAAIECGQEGLQFEVVDLMREMRPIMQLQGKNGTSHRNPKFVEAAAFAMGEPYQEPADPFDAGRHMTQALYAIHRTVEAHPRT